MPHGLTICKSKFTQSSFLNFCLAAFKKSFNTCVAFVESSVGYFLQTFPGEQKKEYFTDRCHKKEKTMHPFILIKAGS